jgi:hypothetical protein
MKAEDFKGKKIGDVITDDTELLGTFYEDAREEILKWVGMYEFGTYAIVRYGEYLICFKDGNPVALFNVYELRHYSINEEHGLLIALGNGRLVQYWFDNEEYIEEVF